MKLGDEFREAMANARMEVERAAGSVLVTMIEAMGYRIVPFGFVNAFQNVLDNDDRKRGER